ncbi:MAG: Ig-like domain-containing protein [Deltaproteobacteria bacterium]|nr:Ig-like domain-containing protein [Deltaproteobacteria bacterium]
MKFRHAALMALLPAGCTQTAETEPDTTPPTVVLASPAPDSFGVSVNQGVAVSFSEPVDPESFEAYRFVVLVGDEIVNGSVTVGGGTAMFTPDVDLASYTTHTATVDSIADLAGNVLAEPYSWTFTTGADPDVTAPTLSAGSPTGDGAGLSAVVNALFSEPIDPSTVISGGLTLSDDASAVAGEITVEGNVVTLDPYAALQPETLYTVDVASSVADLAGNTLGAGASWTFTTQDLVGPAITAVVPADASKGVSVDASLQVQFSEQLDPTSVTGQLTLEDEDGLPVSGATAVAGSALSFTPTSPLAEDAAYTASVAVGITDVYGNPLQAAHSWEFRTDVPFIDVLSVTPAHGATGVPLASDVSVVFDDVIDPASVLSSNVYLVGTAPVAATLQTIGNTVILTPVSPLAVNQAYTLFVEEGGVHDRNGHGLAPGQAHQSSFSTADGIGPEVATVWPADETHDLPFDLSLQVLFTEPIDATSVSAQVTLEDAGAGSVTGSIAVYGSALTFTPDTPLAADTLYTASVDTGITDLYGNPLQAAHSWEFRTDLSYIEVQSVTPVSGAEDVPLDSAVTVVFTDVIDPASVLPSNVYLVGAAPVAATLQTVGSMVILTPSAPLAPNEIHTLYVEEAGVTDLNGNGLDLGHDFESSFTTVALDPVPCSPTQAAACDPHATCAIVDGDPECICSGGYTGNGTVCFNQDECALSLHECDENASCRDTEGSYECTCNEYYDGDGTLCYPIDPKFFIADVSHRPILVEVSGVGSARIEGLGQISSELHFETIPVSETSVSHSLTGHHINDVTMTGVRGLSAADDDALAAWSSLGPPTSVFVHLEGLDGERLLVELVFSDVESASIDFDLCDDSCGTANGGTCDDGLSGSDNATCDAGTDCTDCGARSSGMSELVLSVNDLAHSYTAAVQTPVPGNSIRVEYGGAAENTFLPEDIVEGEIGATSPILLSKITHRESGTEPDPYLDAMENSIQEFTVQGWVTRTSISQVYLDSELWQYDWVNCFETFPSKTYYFNPAKTYGSSPLIDVEFQVEYCEQG